MVIGTGVDIVDIARIARMRSEHGERFHDRIFTAGETAYCLARKKSDQHFAARFAAKEAVMKALGTGWAEGVNFKHIEVIRNENGPPQIKLHGGSAEQAAARGITCIHISLSHSDDTAIAFAIAEGNGSER